MIVNKEYQEDVTPQYSKPFDVIMSPVMPKLYYGKGYSGKIPEGWSLVEREDDWARLKDQDGNMYFTSDGIAYPEVKGRKRNAIGYDVANAVFL